MARKQANKKNSVWYFPSSTYLSPFLLVIRKKQYQNKATLSITLESKEHGKKLFINIKVHSGPDSGPKSYTFEKEAGWALREKERLLRRHLDRDVFPPWGSCGPQPLILYPAISPYWFWATDLLKASPSMAQDEPKRRVSKPLTLACRKCPGVWGRPPPLH